MESINKDEIQSILRNKEKDDSIFVEKIDMQPAVGKGENFMSIAIKIGVKGKIKENNKIVDLRRSLFMKKQFESAEAKELFQSDKLFMNEALAYNEILPALEEGLGEPLATAKCYRADKHQIILEDLFAEGFSMNEGQKSLTVEQCCAILEELAKLHAASYVLKEINPTKFKNLSGSLCEFLSGENSLWMKFFERSFDSTIKLLQSWPQNDEIKTFIDKLAKLKLTIFKDLVEVLNTRTDTDIFNHGDCWMNNLLFKTDSRISVKLVDLQIMRYSSPAADLSYFLSINLRPGLRKEKLDHLLDFYLSCLHSSLRKRNLHQQLAMLNKQWLRREMKRFSKFGFMFGLMIVPVFYANKQDLPDMDQVRPADLDDDEAASKYFVNRDTEEYNTRLTDYLRDFFDEQEN